MISPNTAPSIIPPSLFTVLLHNGQIILEEKLREEETRKFMENAFRDGEIKTKGTDIDKLLPPVSRFNGSSRGKKKQSVIEKFKIFFEKYSGLGNVKFTYPYDTSKSLDRVAEESIHYGEEQ